MKHDKVFAQWARQIEEWIATLPKTSKESDRASLLLLLEKKSEKSTTGEEE
ncbi:MAG: hypothetical protein J7647_26945 [Cyanobacteria bacterium SBLK]|nr:hypothetical protein [Cyanobacteria bacterium SBLK]